MGGQRGQASQVNHHQLRVHQIDVLVDSDGTVLQGADMVTVTKNATGDYTVNINVPFSRILNVGASPWVANLQHQVVSSAAGAVNLVFTNNSGSATDTKFYVGIRGSDDLVYRG